MLLLSSSFDLALFKLTQIKPTLVQCKLNFECKMNVAKSEFRMFGFAMENSSEKDFQCLVIF